MKTLPLDRSREFREIDYPNQPQLYTPLRHFFQRFKEPARHLNAEVINETINFGDVRDNGDGCACFRKEWDGVAYYLIAGFHEEGYRVIVTGWPHLHSRRIAKESGKWSAKELDEIEELNVKYQQKQDDSHPFRDEHSDYNEWLQDQFDSGVKT